ncbi:MAG: hypothetical protein M3512_04355 [Bacteroidota bacterium]|nr:hypothetical protein [Bacteroidota bacterium]
MQASEVVRARCSISNLVLNFNYIFSIGHLYQAGHSTFITSHAMIGFDVLIYSTMSCWAMEPGATSL